MSRMKFFCRAGVVVAAAAVVSGGAFAQDALDTAYVPFVVNVDAAVNARQGENVLPPMAVLASKGNILAIPLGNVSVKYRPRSASGSVSVIANRNGKISLSLPGQSYKSAEISLYTISGKRVLRAKASASELSSSVSRSNLAAGAYLLSVNGTGGRSFSSRFTHGGGNMSINIAFGGGNTLSGSPVAVATAASASDVWTITVSASGYRDSSYTLTVVKGINPTQDITLSVESGVINGGPLDFGGQTYRTVIIGGKRWMAENLNYQTSDSSWCYGNEPDSCKKYGRLYAWSRAVSACQAIGDGWRLPYTADWRRLVDVAGGNNIAGSKLKSQTGWRTQSGISSTDEFGFSALPGGSRYYSGGSFYNAGDNGGWWSATEGGASDALARNMYYYYGNVDESLNYKSSGFSVRCARD